MSRKKLVLRILNSPYPEDITTGKILGWNDVDNNFLNLKGDNIYSASTNGSSLVLIKTDGSSIITDLSGTIQPTTMYWVSGSTGNQAIKANNDSGLDATGPYSLAEGYNTLAGGDLSHAEGYNTIAGGAHSHAEGSVTQAIGSHSHAEGYVTLASGNSSHAEGNNTIAGGSYSHAEGSMTIASGDSSHTEGVGTRAIGDNSHAEGGGSQAIGNYSHAEGGGSQAIGTYSHAEGAGTQAIGPQSHSEGGGTIAIGASSHAEGSDNQAIGANSHVGGTNSSSSGSNSFIHSQNSTIGTGSTNSIILGGFNNTINNNVERSVILGGENIIGNESDTIYGNKAKFSGDLLVTGSTLSSLLVGFPQLPYYSKMDITSDTITFRSKGTNDGIFRISQTNFTSSNIISYSSSTSTIFSGRQIPDVKWVSDTISGLTGVYVNVTGDTMSGNLVVPELSATSVSATTYYGDGSNLSGILSTFTSTELSTQVNITGEQPIYFGTQVNNISDFTVNASTGGIYLNDRSGGGTYIQDFAGGGIYLNAKAGGGIYLSDEGGGGIYLDDATGSGIHLQTSLFTLPISTSPPASPTSTGIKGQIIYTATHIYVCIDTDTWVRTELTTWVP